LVFGYFFFFNKFDFQLKERRLRIAFRILDWSFLSLNNYRFALKRNPGEI